MPTPLAACIPGSAGSTSGILADRAGGPHQQQQHQQQHHFHRGPHQRQPGHASAPHELLDPHPDPFSSLSAASTAAAAAAAAANANADGPAPQASLGALSSSNSHPLSALYRTTSAASGLQPRPSLAPQDESDGTGLMPGVAAARGSTHSVSLSPHMLNTPLNSLPLGLQLSDAVASEPNSATSLMALQQGSLQQHQQQQLGLSGLTPVGLYVGGMGPGPAVQQGMGQQGGVGVAVQQGRPVQAPGPQLQHHLQQLHQHQAAMQQLRMVAAAGQQHQQHVANSPTMAQQQQQQQRGGGGVFVVQSHQALQQQQLQYAQQGPGGFMAGAGSNAGGYASQSATADLSAASLALAGGSTSTLDASEAELELLPGPGPGA